MTKDGEKLRVSLAGLGTVGAALYHLVQSGDYKNSPLPEGMSFPRALEISAVYAKDNKKPCNVLLQDGRTIALDPGTLPWVNDPEDLLASNPHVLVEVTGTLSFGKELIERALKNKIHVVTANKALMAAHGLELAHLAEQSNVALRMEGAVAGGIPVVNTLYGKKNVQKITAILNGTTNFTLDKMTCENLDYADAFDQAGRLGWLESDRTFDVMGRDAAQKTLLLAAIAFGEFTDEADMDVTGITGITPQMIEAGKKDGQVYKLICSAEKDGKLKVAPQLVPSDSIFGKIKGGENVVVIDYADGQQDILRGTGAGGIPTSQSVLLDLAAISSAKMTPTFGQAAKHIERVTHNNSQKQKAIQHG